MRVPAPTWTATTDAYCGEMKRGRHPTEVSRASRAEAEPPAQLPLLSPVDDDSACRTPSWNGRTGSCGGREVWRPGGLCAGRLSKGTRRRSAQSVSPNPCPGQRHGATTVARDSRAREPSPCPPRNREGKAPVHHRSPVTWVWSRPDLHSVFRPAP